MNPKQLKFLTELAARGSAVLEENKKKSTKTATVFYFRSSDRNGTRRVVQAQLKAKKVPFKQTKTSLSSEDITEFQFVGGTLIRLVYKPKSGGMTETTLNSTITELMPCLMFLNNINETDINKAYEKILKLPKGQTCYVTTQDEKAGIDFIEKMPDSSLFKEKMNNAFAILKYLKDVKKTQRVKKVYWTYRAKPPGVPGNSPADIVIEFTPRKLLGVSLKAGSSSSKEPLLNTYVNVIINGFEAQANESVRKLKKILYKETYSKIPGITSADYDVATRGNTLAALEQFERQYPQKYEEYYDANLAIIRNYLGYTMTKSLPKFIKFCRESILKQSDVPVIIIKAVGNQYQEVKDANQLNVLLARATNVVAKASKTSKQNFDLILYEGRQEIGTMNMAVRSNKVGVQHKLGQFFNLAVKYNGLAKK
tara:strand:+ start:1100 stop:2371 length:1272 start_codon:yes stop_codon:yes gene_type:complete